MGRWEEDEDPREEELEAEPREAREEDAASVHSYTGTPRANSQGTSDQGVGVGCGECVRVHWYTTGNSWTMVGEEEGPATVLYEQTQSGR